MFNFLSKFKENNYNNYDDPPRPIKKFWKFWILIFFINLGFAAVVIRLFYVQIWNYDFYQKKAERQHQSTIILSADRGNIYDRNGKVLATTIKGYTIAVDPMIIEDKKNITSILSKYTGANKEKYLSKIKRSKGRFVFLERGLRYHQIEELKSLKTKGLIIIEEPKRIYPYNRTGSQLIGITDIDNKGISGIELGLNQLLNGKNGYMIMNKDAIGKLKAAADLPIIPAIHGGSVKLTIDIDIQNILEYELEQGIINSGAVSATAICIKPNTGEVLGMASYPFFDPSKGQTSSANLRIRSITDTYEPGSTFKLITACAALEEKIVSEETKLWGNGGTANFNGYTIRDVHGLDSATFRQAIHQSSNIIMAKLAAKIDEGKFYSYVRNFGFGLQLGIDMPGEVSGFIPKSNKFNVNTRRYIGHGYSLTSTPLQVVSAYAAVANKGTLMKPFIVKEKNKYNTETDEEEIEEIKPQKIRKIISDETAVRIWDLFRGVVDSGSGKRAMIQGLKISGKTGTSQQIENGKYSKNNYTASFVGFFPSDNPQIALLVVVDRPRASIYGGASAAPIFHKISSRMLTTIPNINLPKNELDSSKLLFTLTPPAQGLKSEDAKKIMQFYDLNLASPSSEGIIFHQNPAINSKLHRGDYVSATLIHTENSNTSKILKHDVTGMTARNAMNILSNKGVRIKLKGTGVVKQQIWDEKDKLIYCTLICQ